MLINPEGADLSHSTIVNWIFVLDMCMYWNDDKQVGVFVLFIKCVWPKTLNGICIDFWEYVKWLRDDSDLLVPEHFVWADSVSAK